MRTRALIALLSCSLFACGGGNEEAPSEAPEPAPAVETPPAAETPTLEAEPTSMEASGPGYGVASGPVPAADLASWTSSETGCEPVAEPAILVHQAGSPLDGHAVIPLLCEGRLRVLVVNSASGTSVALTDHVANAGQVDGVSALDFRDVNGDGLHDLIVVATRDGSAIADFWRASPTGWVADVDARASLTELDHASVGAAMFALRGYYREHR